jgi:hypothetical protein
MLAWLTTLPLSRIWLTGTPRWASLVGLTQAQIAAAHWDTSQPSLPLFRRLVKDRVAEAMKGRAEIQAAPDDTARAIQEQRHKSLEARLKEIRLMGDAVIAAFFAVDRPRVREARGGFETRPYMRLARCDAAQPRSPVTRSRMELCAPSGLQAAPELEP